MSEQSTFEKQYQKKELSTISGKPNNIQIDAIKTKKAYDKAYAEKGIVPTSKTDYPRSGQGYRAIQRLLQFDHIVQPKKGIKKIVNTMVVQPVTVDKQKKYALYMHGRYEGVDAWDSPIGCGFSEGFHYSPKLQFVVTDIAKPFDEKTGERRGEYRPVGYSIIHDIFIPENPKERRKFLENMIKEKNLIIDNCVFSYRQANPDNHHASNHGQISFNNLCDLTFDQLAELQEKTYYKDGSNLYDKDGYTVKYNDGKIQAIK